MMSIADLHCDLLCYLERDSKRTAYDRDVRCAIPQLHAGGVKLQTLAIFSEPGPDCVQRGMAQVKLYQNLPVLYPKDFIHYNGHESSHISLLMAFEGASTFCDDIEPLENGLDRLQEVIKCGMRPLYISLTWNLENRFGGGAHTNVGLKPEGKRLLDLMNEHRIAVDLSHTSDALANDILNYIVKEGLTLDVIASHSNARTILDVPRNLPDDIAKEIFRRGGLVGLNLYKFFIGSEPDVYLLRHLEHWLQLGGAENIVFGADFFYGKDVPSLLRHSHEENLFFEEYPDASCYGRLLSLFEKGLGLSQEQLRKIGYENMSHFTKRSLSR